MQTLYWVNKCRCLFFLIGVSVLSIGSVNAGTSMIKINAQVTRVQLNMDDGSVYALQPVPHASRLYYDAHKYLLERDTYIAVFQVLDSNAAQPSGYCGAGNEVWLHVYQAVDQQLSEKARVQVSSCLAAFSLASQSSGDPLQEWDFSSVKWLANGFSIEWFNKRNAAGRSLSSTRYVVHDTVFSPLDAVSDDLQSR